MTPHIVGAKVQTIVVSVLHVDLETVVVVVAVRILIGQGAQVRIGLEEVDRIRAGHVKTGGYASRQLISHHPAQIRSSGGQRISQRACNALVQILNECSVPEALASGKRRLTAERPERRLKNGKSRLTGQIVVGECLATAVGDVDVEVPFRLNELIQETVLKDIG